jgi:hypothetical protein
VFWDIGFIAEKKVEKDDSASDEPVEMDAEEKAAAASEAAERAALETPQMLSLGHDPRMTENDYSVEILFSKTANGKTRRVALIEKQPLRGQWTGELPRNGGFLLARVSRQDKVHEGKPMAAAFSENLIADPVTQPKGEAAWQGFTANEVRKVADGPRIGGDHTVFQPVSDSEGERLIVGPRIRIESDQDYFQSAWLRFAGDHDSVWFGRRYLDADGRELQTTHCNMLNINQPSGNSRREHSNRPNNASSDDRKIWIRGAELLSQGDRGETSAAERIPDGAVFIEPVLHTGRGKVEWDALYLGEMPTPAFENFDQ